MGLQRASEIAEMYRNRPGATIGTLQDIQEQDNYLSAESLVMAAKALGVPLSQLYSVATFYSAFSLKPRGRHVISVCLGTACQVRQAPRLLDKVVETLKIGPGETSKDMRFSLNTVNCLGCCALGPVMVVDGKYYSNPTPEALKKITSGCE
jgi:NADH-quinone oxidoreductase subunit E